jgi:hypothetical protein
MRSALLFSIGVALAAPASSLADPPGAPCPELTAANQWDPGYSAHLDGLSPISRKARAILAVRREGLLMKKQDGGFLSSAHREVLQAQLDAIQSGRY